MGRESWQQDSHELLRALNDLETRMRCHYSDMLHILAELETRNVVAEQGYPPGVSR